MALEEAILAESGFLGHRDGDAYSAHPEAHLSGFQEASSSSQDQDFYGQFQASFFRTLIFSHYFALQIIRRFMEHWETFIVE